MKNNVIKEKDMENINVNNEMLENELENTAGGERLAESEETGNLLLETLRFGLRNRHLI